MTLIEYDRYIQLVTDSAILQDLKAEQLPELRFALVIILILVAACIGLGLMLRHSERRNLQLHGIINEDHIEDSCGSTDRLDGKKPGKWVREAVEQAGAESWDTATDEQREQAIAAVNKRCGIGGE